MGKWKKDGIEEVVNSGKMNEENREKEGKLEGSAWVVESR